MKAPNKTLAVHSSHLAHEQRQWRAAAALALGACVGAMEAGCTAGGSQQESGPDAVGTIVGGSEMGGSQAAGGTGNTTNPGRDADLTIDPGDWDNTDPTGIGDTPEVCAADTSQAIVTTRPVDIILSIDNSGSMTKEIESVERNINENLARILDASGIDYRVILVSFYEPWVPDDMSRFLGVCISDPLGPNACATRSPTASPHGSRFFHYHQRINSQDAFCALVDSATAPSSSGDETVEYGWFSLLRPDSFKSFLSIGDDSVKLRAGREDFLCSSSDPKLAPLDAAQKFDDWLLGAAPAQFGTKEARNYTWHSIVGVGEKADPTEPYQPGEPLVTSQCETAEDPGQPRQELSRMTGGLRFPVCYHDNYDSVFQAIAASVVERAELPCNWNVPAPPEGKTFEAGLLNLEYLPGGGGEPVGLVNVDSPSECAAVGLDAWYYNNPVAPSQVFACPSTCEKLKGDETGSVELKLGCATLKPPTVR